MLSPLIMGLVSSSAFRSFLGKPMASRLELSLTWVGRGSEGLTDAAEDGGEVLITGNFVQSLEGGMKPALAPVLICCLFLSKDASDTVIWTGEGLDGDLVYLSHLVRVAPVQAEGDQQQGDQDESVRRVEVSEDQAGHCQTKQNVGEGEGDMKDFLLVIIFNAPKELFNDVEIQDEEDY